MKSKGKGQNRANLIADLQNFYDFERKTVANQIEMLAPEKLMIGDRIWVKRVWVTVEKGDIRIRFDGGSPTGGLGHLIPAGGNFTIRGTQNIKNLKMIRDGSKNADICASFGH